MTELAHPATDYAVVEAEPRGILERNLSIASRLWASATIFFFFAFLFAYFYLRSLNEQHLWKPKNVVAPQGWGAAVVLCVVASAVLLWFGRFDQSDDRRRQWRLKGVGALVFGLGAVCIQVVAWTQIGFGPTDGGYASVYLGWTGLYALFLLGTLFWLETCLATSYRYREHTFGLAEVEPGHGSGDPYRTAPDITNPVHLNLTEVAALSFYWTVLAVVGVVTWFVLYVL